MAEDRPTRSSPIYGLEGRAARRALENYRAYQREYKQWKADYMEELERRKTFREELETLEMLKDWHIQKLERCHRQLLLKQGKA